MFQLEDSYRLKSYVQKSRERCTVKINNSQIQKVCFTHECLDKTVSGALAGGPEAETLRSHCRGPGSILGPGTTCSVTKPSLPASTKTWCSQEEAGLIQLTLPMIVKGAGHLLLDTLGRARLHQQMPAAAQYPSHVWRVMRNSGVCRSVRPHPRMGIYCGLLLNHTSPDETPLGGLGEAIWPTSTPHSLYSEFLGPDGTPRLKDSVLSFYINQFEII